jgi:hypothetical protein
MPRKLLLLALLVCGCGTAITYTPIASGGGRPYKLHAAQVDLYLSGPPDRPYRDIGLLEAEQETDLSLDDTRDMLHKLREAAGQHGCDAIYVKGAGSNAAPVAGVAFRYTDSVKTLTATCIRYVEDARQARRE